MTRSLRDIEAEAMRTERLGRTRPTWNELTDDGQEHWRQRADHLARIRTELSAGRQMRAVEEDEIVLSADALVGDPTRERIVKRSQGKWWIGLRDRKTGEITIEQGFTIVEATLLAGAVLQNDPEVVKRPALGKLLAAAIEIFRLNAAGYPVE